jgi:hypothetical protein
VKSSPSDKTPDLELSKVTEALVRAGMRARELALQTHTAVITWKDGKVVRTFPHQDSPREVPANQTAGKRK